MDNGFKILKLNRMSVKSTNRYKKAQRFFEVNSTLETAKSSLICQKNIRLDYSDPMYNVKMARLLQFAAVLALTVSLCALRAKRQDQLESVTNKQKGMKMLSHRPWYSGKRGVFTLHSEVGKKSLAIKQPP